MNASTYSDGQSEVAFRTMLEEWSRISKFRESGSIYIYHKGTLFRRYEALTKRLDLVTEYFQGKLPILIDIEAGHFEDTELLEAEFKKHELENNNPIYWICGVDQFLLGQSPAIFHYLRKRQAEKPAISYVLFFSINFLHPAVSSVLLHTSTFLQNTYIMPLYDESMSSHFIKYLLEKWQMAISSETENHILLNTKHHPLLIKQAIRHIRDTTTTDLSEILHHQMMELKVKSVFDDLLISEQTAMSKIVRGENDFGPDEHISIDFLKKTGWLSSVQHRLKITIPLLEKYVTLLHTSTKKFFLSDNGLLLNGVPIESFFSEQEVAVLKLLVKKTGQIVKRDEIAQMIWGNDWAEVYSDWAIDKLVSRIRQKCFKLNVSKSLIRSVKGKGFTYVIT